MVTKAIRMMTITTTTTTMAIRMMRIIKMMMTYPTANDNSDCIGL